MMATPLVSTVQAKITEVNRYGPPDFPAWFTEYYGTLGGANFYVLIPDVWENPLGDGMLVVICRSAAYFEDPRDSVPDYPFAQGLATQGIAVATSNYGTSEAFIKEGVIRTHQLTMYVIDNYGVTGKVFLFGTSLGGAVALLLGERHPNVYNGVLDNSGLKDLAESYNDAVSYLEDPPLPLDPFLLFWYAIVKAGFEDRYGGTPEERPNKYAKYSPTHHADITIPVISVVHVGDMLVELTQTELYHAALSDPTLHYVAQIDAVYPGALPPIFPPPVPAPSSWYGHFDPYTFMAAAYYFPYVVLWSNGVDSPPFPPFVPPPPP